jgi:hypothetical protein
MSKLSLFTMINAYKTLEQVCLLYFSKDIQIISSILAESIHYSMANLITYYDDCTLSLHVYPEPSIIYFSY